MVAVDAHLLGVVLPICVWTSCHAAGLEFLRLYLWALWNRDVEGGGWSEEVNCRESEGDRPGGVCWRGV
jgi:hypothetical protein